MGLQGVFITVEGGEGVGKSTFLAELHRQLQEFGVSSIVTREPGGTPIADCIRSIFVKPHQSERLDHLSELLLVSAARRQHMVHAILPALQRGEWVICDRFADSTRVYQGSYQDINLEFMENVIAASTSNIQPDLTFILDCPTELSMKRLSARANHEEASRFDSQADVLHEHRRKAFQNLASQFPNRCFVLDSSGSNSQTVGNAIQLMRNRGLIAG